MWRVSLYQVLRERCQITLLTQLQSLTQWQRKLLHKVKYNIDSRQEITALLKQTLVHMAWNKWGRGATNLVGNGDQGSAKVAEFHVRYFAEKVLTSTDLVQQHGHVRARVRTILQTLNIAFSISTTHTRHVSWSSSRRNGNFQTPISVPAVRPKQCHILSNPAHRQNYTVACLNYTLQTMMPSPGWPVMAPKCIRQQLSSITRHLASMGSAAGQVTTSHWPHITDFVIYFVPIFCQRLYYFRILKFFKVCKIRKKTTF